MNNIFKAFLALMVSVPLTAAADSLPKPVADMECLVGVWRGGGSLLAGKDKSKLDAAWTCQRTSSAFGVLCTFHVTGIPGMGAYDETDLMGYEPNTNTYHWYSVTNAGETHDHVAKVSDSNAIRFVFNGTQQGKAFKEVIDLSFAADKKALSGRAETFLAGVSTSVMSLNLSK